MAWYHPELSIRRSLSQIVYDSIPMTSLLHTRIAFPTDFAAMYALWYDRAALLIQVDPRALLPDQVEQRWMQHYHRLVSAERVRIAVAVEAERVIGYAVGRWDEDAMLVREAEIELMAIDLHAPHRGAARALVGMLRAWFTTEGVSRILVRVPRYSAVEQAFWHAQGARAWDEVLWLK